MFIVIELFCPMYLIFKYKYFLFFLDILKNLEIKLYILNFIKSTDASFGNKEIFNIIFYCYIVAFIFICRNNIIFNYNIKIY
jgi:hypothetical protein